MTGNWRHCNLIQKATDQGNGENGFYDLWLSTVCICIFLRLAWHDLQHQHRNTSNWPTNGSICLVWICSQSYVAVVMHYLISLTPRLSVAWVRSKRPYRTLSCSLTRPVSRDPSRRKGSAQMALFSTTFWRNSVRKFRHWCHIVATALTAFLMRAGSQMICVARYERKKTDWAATLVIQ